MRTPKKTLVVGMVSSFVFSTMLAPVAYAKKPIFDLPPAEKIDVAPEAAAPPVELAPVKLEPVAAPAPERHAPVVESQSIVAPTAVAPAVHTQPEVQESIVNATPVTQSEDGTLQAGLNENGFLPKGPMEGNNALLAPMSVKGSKRSEGKSSIGGTMVDQALKVNAAPLPLVETPGDASQKGDEQACIEREQLTALWEATLTKSPDIQFVLQKLLPSSDPSRVTSVLMRTLGTVAMGGIGAVGAISPTPGTYIIQNLGYSTLNQLLSIGESKKAQKARISQSEAIMLFKMIRDTADNLVDKFRGYKKQHFILARANTDFEDLKGMAQGAREGQDASKQLEIEYTLRRQQRDIEGIGQDLGKFRQGLVDLAGGEAVNKLDMSIDEEFQKLHPDLLAGPNKTEGQQIPVKEDVPTHTVAEQPNTPAQVGPPATRAAGGPITATHTAPERTPAAGPLVAPTNGAVPN